MGITLWFKFSFSLSLMKFNSFHSFIVHLIYSFVKRLCKSAIFLLSFYLFLVHLFSISDSFITNLYCKYFFFCSIYCLFTPNGVFSNQIYTNNLFWYLWNIFSCLRHIYSCVWYEVGIKICILPTWNSNSTGTILEKNNSSLHCTNFYFWQWVIIFNYIIRNN